METKLQYALTYKYARIGFILLLALMVVISYSPIAAYSSGQFPPSYYYVSTDGDDANPGTLEAPWRTIQKAADTIKAGSTVLVRGGIYEEFVTINVSGSEPEGYITFQAYPGEQPVIDGSNLTIASGKNALIQIRSSNYIIVEGFEVRNLSSTSSSQYPAGIRVQYGGSNIHLLNNNVHHISNYSPDGNAHGIHVYGNALLPLTNIKVSGNQVHHLTLGSSESLTLSGNIDGFIVDHNIVHDNNNIGIDIAGFYGACSSPCLDQARNGAVTDNTVYNIDSSINPAYGSGSNSAGGIYADGAANVVIERNHVYNSDFGIEIASENHGKTTSHITVRNNFIHHNDGAGIIMGGSAIDNGGASDNLIANNTLILNDQLQQGYGEITLQQNNHDNHIINNIIYGSPNIAMVKKSNTSGSGNVVDYNLYYRSDGIEGGKWRWNGQSYPNWQAYKEGTGHDTNSLFVNPEFNDLNGLSIKLNANSPAIDRGMNRQEDVALIDYYGSLRKQGSAIDMGASEFAVETAPTPTTQPEETPTPTPTTQPEKTPIATPTTQPEVTPTPTPAPTITPSPAPSTNPGPEVPSGTIQVDGNFEDWASIVELSNGSSNVKSMKALIENQELHVLITGHLLGEKGQLYLNTDGNGDTGFQAPFWSGAGADYLLENGILYAYSGEGGTNWKWTEIRSYKKLGKFVATSTVVEASLALQDLGTGSASPIQLGYVWKDSHENKLPTTRELSTVSGNGSPHPDPGQPEQTIIKVDGEAKDWSGVTYLATGASNPKGLKVFHDQDYLYLLIEGSGLTSKMQVYMNTDSKSSTGYKASNWSSGGAEYLLESGRIYAYTGKGSNWSWKERLNLKKINSYIEKDAIVEVAIPLAELGVRKGDSITIGVLLNDNKSTQLPVNGEMKSYTLQ